MESSNLIYERPRTLCEICGRACGRCSWSEKDRQEPVKGWEAVRRDVEMRTESEVWMEESYVVLDCPEYEPEMKYWWYILAFDKEYARREAEKEIEGDDQV